MKLTLIGLQDQQLHRATHKLTLTYVDIAALGASTTGTIQIIPLTGLVPVGSTVRCARIDLITAFDFSDAAINSLLVEVGDGNSTARFLTQTEIAIDGTEVLHKVSGGLEYSYPSEDGVDAKFTVAGGGTPLLNECTSGEIDIYLEVRPGTPMRPI